MTVIGKIKLVSVNINDPDHVGQKKEWDYEVLINNVYLEINQELTVVINDDKINFLINAWEKDKLDDVMTITRDYSYQASKGRPLVINARVKENRGKFFGNTAVVSFHFEIK